MGGDHADRGEGRHPGDRDPHHQHPSQDTVLTDGDGRTIYLFTKDGKNPPKTTCEGQCATTWPPVVARGETRIEGVDPKLVGTVTRPDGTEQVTVVGTWFAIETNGCKVAAEKKPLAAAPSSY
ncbi:hypothetical protein [Amycolatopsis methanolica]|uniref:hypothetical protein n=1 Tax=Amycolatopsis methanolica TaxID=1814 RepID=UPI00036C50A5|nr:hypothetical protein [Amycolatopsis methanolica]